MIVRFTSEAAGDLEAIGDYIAADNPVRAISFLGELRDRCNALAAFPRRFPLVSRYERHGIRRCIHGDYLIFYRIEAETIAIVHILHGATDYEHILF